MDEIEFWSLIDRARESAEGDPDRQADTLYQLLQGRPEPELQAFGTMFRMFRARAYRWDLWEAGSLINEGMGDDSFDDFRAWLISRGRTVYEQALANPDTLADVPEVQQGRDVTAELFSGVIYEVYEDTHGRVLETDAEVPPAIDLGEELSDDELRSRLPRLYALKSQST
jgi:hypothetical protein